MPEGWKDVDLGDLLSQEQIDQVVKLAKRYDDDFKFTQHAKTYLRSIEAELEAKGVLPDFMAYMLTAMLPVLRAVEDSDPSLN